jgi:transcriptional activator SPT8
VPAESGEIVATNGTFSSNDHKPTANGVKAEADPQTPQQLGIVATPDSLFGDNGDGDLFGDAGGALTNGEDTTDLFGDVPDEMSRAIANGPEPEEIMDHTMEEATDNPTDAPREAGTSIQDSPGGQADHDHITNGVLDTVDQPLTNGLPHAETLELNDHSADTNRAGETPPTSDSTFLATSIDGAIRVWDRRQPEPVARILPRNTPPWCLSACWSPDGDSIYAGRRNNTVEEYDLRKGLKEPSRIFRFPNGSGAVTSVKAMPNGRHLICASYDILRLYDLKETQSQRSTVPFLIVPGHRTGVVSHLYLDPACRFMLSTGGNRGWEGMSTEVLLGYEIGVPNQ